MSSPFSILTLSRLSLFLPTARRVWSPAYTSLSNPLRPPSMFLSLRYNWNQYNKTHYDHDNPPPKVVQGYKFNIFYPDLINKRKTPTYSVEACAQPAFAILRFSAGAPYGKQFSLLSFFSYIASPSLARRSPLTLPSILEMSSLFAEDIAFKIVNREWNTQRKHGFKCTFSRGVLSLWFNFKLLRYRR